MSGNTFGRQFCVTSFGESHGAAIGCVVDGCPPGLELTEADIQRDLDRRKPGTSRHVTQRREPDTIEILSGVFEGRTTGTPIGLLIRNVDQRSRDYGSIMNAFRPGHADYTYWRKYGIRDYRGGGRASARETAARVAAGAVARLMLARSGVQVTAYTVALGGVATSQRKLTEIADNRLGCPDNEAAGRMEERLEQVRKQGDTLGGIVEILVTGCPAGLGEPVFDKLDGELAKALMSIGAVKGVEIGAGFAVAGLLGSQNNDPITPAGFTSNNAGGILAGISSGQDIVARVAVKPIPSIAKAQQTVNLAGEPVIVTIGGRHDIAAIPRILPVCEAMVCLTLADFLLRQQAVAAGR